MQAEIETALKLYPALRDEVCVHLYPGEIHIKAPGAGNKVVKSHAWEVLRLCDGLRSVDDIVATLSGEWELEPPAVISFLRDSKERGYVEWHEAPQPTHSRVFGDGKTCMPKMVSFKLTNKCNLRCTYCYGTHGPEKREFFPADKVEWLFDLLERSGTTVIELTGGEPLLHPAFPAILDAATKRFHVSILSNGVLFTEPVFDLISRRKKSIGIQISIDGSNEEVSCRLRGVPNTAEASFRTIERLVEMGVNLRVGLVLTHDNVDDCLATCERMRRAGVKRLSIATANAIGRGAGLSFPDGTPYRDMTESFAAHFQPVLRRAITEYPDVVVDPSQVREHLRDDVLAESNCGAGWQKIVLDPNGDVLPCLLLESGTGKLGNLFSQDIIALLNETPLARACRRFSIKDGEAACLACRYAIHCRRCLARVYTANLRRVQTGEGLCDIALAAALEEAFDFSYPLPVQVSTQWGD